MCEMVAKCGETWQSSARWRERPGFLANNSTGTLINLILPVIIQRGELRNFALLSKKFTLFKAGKILNFSDITV
jgi:hypothetical protein